MVALLRIPPQTKELPLWDEVGGEQVIVGYKTVPAPLFAPSTEPDNVIATFEPDVYLCSPMPVTLPEGATVILEYQDNGIVTQADLDAYLEIRPLGNNNGFATDALRYHHFMGDFQPKLGNANSTDPIEQVYPDNNRPLAIEVRHKLFTGNANPEWDGWGWRAEIIGGAASRSPAARAIGIYSDAACTEYLYTTGAFTLQQSVWQVDSQGNPLTVWATEYNPGLLGYPNDNKQDVHHACLFGSAKEGYATLRASQERVYHEFWEHDQGYVPEPSATWVNTGVTITQLVGAGIYRVSGIPTITLNQPIRLGPTAETVFTGYWPTTETPSDYIKITPHVSASVGSIVWKWE